MRGTFKLFQNTRIVKGASRSTICDLQKQVFEFLPNEIADFLNVAQGTIDTTAVLSSLSGEDVEVFASYINFLVEKEYGMLCSQSEVNYFQDNAEFDLWEYPAVITNGIIDVHTHSKHDYQAYFSIYQYFQCEVIQLRFFDVISINELAQIIRFAIQGGITCLNIVLRHDPNLDNAEYISLINLFPNIDTLAVHGHYEDAVLTDGTLGFGRIITVIQTITSEQHCGNINYSDFAVNVATYSEGLKFNTCLNRKLSVNSYGEICNCPSITSRFGSMTLGNAKSALENSLFFKYWQITKDQIEVCKLCEFRAICTDCRAYTKQDGLYDKPSKCNYNPTTLEWETQV